MMNINKSQIKLPSLPGHPYPSLQFAMGLLIAFLLAVFSPIMNPALATDSTLSTENTSLLWRSPLPAFREFVVATKTGNPDSLVGVYVPGVLALPVVQQPDNQPGFVSSAPGVVTQFRMAKEYGTDALLAHNYLSGSLFFNLQTGQRVILVYGDGKVKFYEVTEMNSYQALSPTDPYSNFIDISNPETVLSAAEVFLDNYGVAGRLVFQTCIESQGIESWGRLFITAQPVQRSVVIDRTWNLSF